MKIYQRLILTVALLSATNCFAQTTPPKASDLTIVNRNLSLGTDGSLHLNEADNAGFAWINNKQFNYGTIEFDVKGRDQEQGSFVGVAYHVVNDSTYESVYFRPFNFLAADALKRSHGVEYIAMPNYDWFVLRERFPAKYEHEVSPAPNPNGWFHVRVVIDAKLVQVYVNDGKEPVLKVEPIVTLNGTRVGYWVGNGSPGDFKNLTITAAQ